MFSRVKQLRGPLVTAIVAGLAYYCVPPSLYKSVAQVSITEDERMSIASKIASNVIKRAPSGPESSFGELWKDQTSVVVFFRRLAAREVSAIKPILDSNNVKLVGVGLEDLGVEEFIDGKFFNGDLYIDTDKKSYNALGFKRFGFFGLFPAVLSSLARAAQSRGKALKLGGNMAGDGYQNGGALVVGKGGETLYHYVQEEAPDHASNAEILKALGLEVPNPVPTAESADPGTCQS